MDQRDSTSQVKPIPRSIFDARELPIDDRLPAWRDSFSVIYDYQLDASVGARGFHARIENYLFEHFMLANFKASAAIYDRPANRIARDGVDMIMVQMYEYGPCELLSHPDLRPCGAEDIVIMDMSRPMKSRHRDQHNLTLCLPRALLQDYLPKVDGLHLATLDGQLPLTRLLRSHIRSLYWNVATLDVANTRFVTRPTLELVASAIREAMGDGVDFQTPVTTALRTRAEYLIHECLADPGLAPDRIADAVPCSRSRLFEIFEADGGVQGYIRRLRLRRVLSDLQNRTQRNRTVSAIANDWGFQNVSSFNRAFKREFGITPREARYDVPRKRFVGEQLRSNRQTHSRLYESWVSGLLSSSMDRSPA